MNKKIHLCFTIPSSLAGKRLDQALASLATDYSRARLQRWIETGCVQVDKQTELRVRRKVLADQTLDVEAQLETETTWQPQAIELTIVYEDPQILVVNKPAGLVVHPAVGNRDRTLVNALLHHLPELAQLPRAGIVHRLDKDTSGLLVVAKTMRAHQSLIKQLQARTMGRRYYAIVNGKFVGGGTVDAPIGRHPHHRVKMAVVESGKPAVTHYRILERFAHHTLVECKLETGRTHQIRVHMASTHHPIVGEPVYGGRLQIAAGCTPILANALRHFRRQALHAIELSLVHPLSGETLQFSAPLPDDMEELLKTLRTPV